MVSADMGNRVGPAIGSQSVSGPARILGIFHQSLAGTTLRPRLSKDIQNVSYKWLRGDLLENPAEASKDLPTQTWTYITTQNEYTPIEDDEMHRMRVEATVPEDQQQHDISFEFSVLPAPPTPPLRRMLPISGAPIHDGDFTFSLMSYNLLAECYCDSHRYDYCPEYALAWEYRQKIIFKEIEQYKPDIFCLQEFEEVPLKQFQRHFKGYDSEYVKRTMMRSDGCGVFFNRDKFKLVKKFAVEMDKLVEESPELAPFPELAFKTRKNNVAIILLLKAVTADESHKYVWVSNGHLYWDPKEPEIKLMQAWYLLRCLHRLQRETSTELNIAPEQCTTLACGDFNSLPYSMVYELHHTQRIKATVVPQIVKYSSVVEFTSPLSGLESSYKPLGDPISNYTANFKGCLDYIWYQPASCTLLEVLENPTASTDAALVQSLDTYGALPNPIYPSDHLPLMAKYVLKAQK